MLRGKSPCWQTSFNKNPGYASATRSAISHTHMCTHTHTKKKLHLFAFCAELVKKSEKQLEGLQFIIALSCKDRLQWWNRLWRLQLSYTAGTWLRRKTQLRTHDKGRHSTAKKNNDKVKICSRDLVSKAASVFLVISLSLFFFVKINIQSRHLEWWRTFPHF